MKIIEMKLPIPLRRFASVKISENKVIKWVLPELVLPCKIIEQLVKIEHDKNNKQCFCGFVKVFNFLWISSLSINSSHSEI